MARFQSSICSPIFHAPSRLSNMPYTLQCVLIAAFDGIRSKSLGWKGRNSLSGGTRCPLEVPAFNFFAVKQPSVLPWRGFWEKTPRAATSNEQEGCTYAGVFPLCISGSLMRCQTVSLYVGKATGKKVRRTMPLEICSFSMSLVTFVKWKAPYR